MSTQLVSHSQKLNLADLLDTALTSNGYYFFIADHLRQSAPIDLFDYDRDTLIDVYHNMILGQRISVNNATVVIRNIPYVSGTFYATYDDSDQFLSDKKFYTTVHEGALYHTYKCLDNNFEGASTITPTFADINGANTNFYQTSDGYVWKYMYSVTDTDVLKFGTTDFFPVIANSVVSASAIPGALDVIDIETVGRGYNNYLYDTFSGADIKINGNTLVYALVNSIASGVNTFYTGCLIYLSDGTGAGQYQTITDYFTTNTGKYIVLDNAFAITPQNGTKFQITPKVNVFGSGDQTINAVGRALINSASSNSIFKIEMLSRGLGYSFLAANVSASPVVALIQKAALRPIYGPAKGHGFDARQELFGTRLIINSKFNSNTITINTNSFAQIGILKNPIFTLATVGHDSNSSVGFLAGEKVSKISPLLISQNAVLSTTNPGVICNGANFNNQVNVGTFLYLQDATLGNNQLAVVNSIINSTSITISSNGYFNSNTVNVYLANRSANATISYISNGTSINLSSIGVGFNTNDKFIGETSGAIGNVVLITVSGLAKNFDTYVGLYKYSVTPGTGTFLQDELVSTGNLSIANAYLHSVVGNNTIYTSNQVGQFTVGSVIVGQQSSATATINTKYLPEIIFGSGQVLYLENIDPKTRSNNDVETFKTIFEF